MKQLGENIVIVLGGRAELQAGDERGGAAIRLNYSDVQNLRREAWLSCRPSLRNWMATFTRPALTTAQRSTR